MRRAKSDAAALEALTELASCEYETPKEIRAAIKTANKILVAHPTQRVLSVHRAFITACRASMDTLRTTVPAEPPPSNTPWFGNG